VRFITYVSSQNKIIIIILKLVSFTPLEILNFEIIHVYYTKNDSNNL